MKFSFGKCKGMHVFNMHFYLVVTIQEGDFNVTVISSIKLLSQC